MDYKEIETTFQTQKQKKAAHPACVIYEGVCIWRQTYIDKTGLRWDEMRISLNPARFSPVTSANVRTSPQNFDF